MKRILWLLLILGAVQVQAQDITQYKRVVKELSSARYQGRGYAKGGANKAGKFLEEEFRKAGVDEVTLQPFTIDINTFPGKMELWADGKKLTPGIDFSMREYSPGVKGTFPVYHIDTLNFNPERLFADLEKPEYQDCMVCCDFWFTYKHREVFSKLQKAGACPNAGLIYTWSSPIKFYKAYGDHIVDKPIIWVTPEAMEGVKSIRANVENRFLKGYEIFNVIAKVEGARHDSCYVFTAHYDHLGNLGSQVFYAGANDNASGTATIVTLAAHYARHRPQYDMYFIAFSGEDANLRGSEYYAQHPLVPLSQIKYLFNIDMIGDNNPVQYCECSDEGLRGFALFEEINGDKQLFQALHRGELAANSDHYPFATRHVPCIFLENENGDAFPYYHTIFDNWETAVFTSYEPVFTLVTEFVSRYSSPNGAAMAAVNQVLEELKGRDVVLFVADKEEIAPAEVPFPVVFTGMGKMRMFSGLVKWRETLPEGSHPVVLNIGSAGSAKYPIGTIVNCTRIFNGGGELVHDCIALPGEGASIFSGDYFMSTQTFSPEQVKELSQQYDLFDMEAYAAALFCQMYDIPFYCLKAVSDNLDGNLKDWRSILADIRARFTELLNN